MTVRLIYEIGVDPGDNAEMAEALKVIKAASNLTPEKHELFAKLLLMAAREEWREADRMRHLWAVRQRQEARKKGK
ncbi:MAG TPA: hypothetical protein VK735_39750 [Pseudonocardia sp.]|uniref:hypothetical protein n=1 Tax=Pseudonocardia sp. TaxID=60912 RepID=UPI002BDECF66|nr:hypothetical protein [Pseudonocardia sp.]HTF53618.1 hypothetical protein [Pseudonocardia sp.]